MTEFWKIAVGLTGVAGVGSLVFFALYKRWLTLPALASLTRDQRFFLFKLFLILTFVFGIASLCLAAYQSKLQQSKFEQSRAELQRILEQRRETGEHALAEQQARPDLSAEQKTEIKQIHNEYSRLTRAAGDALAKGDSVRYHEATKETVQLLESSKAKKALPEETRIHVRNHGCGSGLEKPSGKRSESSGVVD